MTDGPTDNNAGIKTDADLIEVLNIQLVKFANGALVLSQKEVERLQKFTDLVKKDRSTIKNHAVKKRAHRILTDFSNGHPPAFFLCALGTVISKVGRLTSESYMGAVTNWWRHDVIKWRGLVQTMEMYKEHLPVSAPIDTLISTTAPEQTTIVVRLRDLRRVVDYIPDQDIVVRLPDDGTLPCTQFGSENWQVRQDFSWGLLMELIKDMGEGSGASFTGN